MIDCLAYFFGVTLGNIASGLGCIILVGLVGVQRKQFRQQFNIPGDDLEDFFCSCCCQCCVLAQMDRHLGLSESRGCVCQDPGPAQNIPAFPAFSAVAYPQQQQQVAYIPQQPQAVQGAVVTAQALPVQAAVVTAQPIVTAQPLPA